jgi:nicotinate phosphoribosyltransferase
LLVDTYDTLIGTTRAAAIGPTLRGIRIDSGDLGRLAVAARKLLDERGLKQTRIIASSDLDEYAIEALVADQTPIDVFGVGTALITVADGPALAGVYKLVELGGVPRVKLSPGKKMYAGRKQVYRCCLDDGTFSRDLLALVNEAPPAGAALLQPVLRRGRLVAKQPTLAAIRAHCQVAAAGIPAAVAVLQKPASYPVEISSGLVEATQAAELRSRSQAAGRAES